MSEIDGWKTIDSAPKDGTWVDGWATNTVTNAPIGRMTNIRWLEGSWRRGPVGMDFDVEAPIFAETGHPVVRVTHWMTLPSPPEPQP